MRQKNVRHDRSMPSRFLAGTAVLALVLLIAWVTGSQVLAAPPAQPVTQALPKGDPAIGKNLFMGTTSLENGGPPCMACHGIAGMGALGGGALGPDLTGSYGKLSSAMITWPETVPPMRAVFSTKPLTQEEKANLVAFFQSASVAQRPASSVGLLAVLGSACAAVLVLLANLFWRRRLRGVRKPMVMMSHNR